MKRFLLYFLIIIFGFYIPIVSIAKNSDRLAQNIRRIHTPGVKTMFLEENDLSSFWIKFLNSAEAKKRNFPVVYSNGKIEWRQDGSQIVDSRREGNFVLELNTLRAQRPHSSDSKNKPCLFCRLSAEKQWNDVISYQGWKMLVNPFPIVKEGHFTIIREAAGHIPQRLAKDDVLFALQFMQEAKNLVLIFNSWDAGASQNHLHFQAFYSNMTKLMRSVNLEFIESRNNVSVSRLKDSPAQGIVFEGGNLQERAGLINQYLVQLDERNMAYNCIFLKGRTFLFPRSAKSPEKFPEMTLGAFEVAGRFIFSDPELFNSITEADLFKIIKEVTITEADLFTIIRGVSGDL